MNTKDKLIEFEENSGLDNLKETLNKEIKNLDLERLEKEGLQEKIEKVLIEFIIESVHNNMVSLADTIMDSKLEDRFNKIKRS